MDKISLKGKRILIVINNLDFFLSHRQEIAEMLVANQSEVLIACPKNKALQKLDKINIKHIEFNISRSGINPVFEFITFIKLLKIIFKVKPHLIHTITMKGIVHGGLIARIFRIPNLIAFSGLGHSFINHGFKLKKTFTKNIINCLLRLILKNPKKIIIFHNKEDLKELQKFNKIKEDQTIITHGSGINLEAFRKLKFPSFENNKIIGLFASRLLKTKGIMEISMASEMVHKINKDIEIWLIGDVDFGNPDSVSKSYLEKLAMMPNIKYFGFQERIQDFLEDCHFVILPSYREGMPKFLLEASAAGKAILTTNVPGCKECVIDGENGLLALPKDHKDLAKKILQIAESKDKLREFGNHSKKIAFKNYSVNHVVDKHKWAYIKLLS